MQVDEVRWLFAYDRWATRRYHRAVTLRPGKTALDNSFVQLHAQSEFTARWLCG